MNTMKNLNNKRSYRMDEGANAGDWGICEKHKLAFVAFDEQLWE